MEKENERLQRRKGTTQDVARRKNVEMRKSKDIYAWGFGAVSFTNSMK